MPEFNDIIEDVPIKPYYRDEQADIVIYCADCREVLPHIRDKSIDLVLTDPPYNVSQKNSDIKFKITERKNLARDFGDWDYNFDPTIYWDEFNRLVNNNGQVYIFTAHNLFGKWYELLERDFGFSNFLVWYKNNPMPQVRKRSFLSSCELIIRSGRGNYTINFINQNDMHNLITYPCRSDNVHPTQKPERLISKLVNIASNPNSLILDPFLGSGTTAYCAKKLGRKCIGIEIEEKYCAIAAKRLSQSVMRLET